MWDGERLDVECEMYYLFTSLWSLRAEKYGHAF